MRGSFGIDEHCLEMLVRYDSLRIVLLCNSRNERKSQNKGELLLEPPPDAISKQEDSCNFDIPSSPLISYGLSSRMYLKVSIRGEL